MYVGRASQPGAYPFAPPLKQGPTAACATRIEEEFLGSCLEPSGFWPFLSNDTFTLGMLGNGYSDMNF